jgi:hypothetical protein
MHTIKLNSRKHCQYRYDAHIHKTLNLQSTVFLVMKILWHYASMDFVADLQSHANTLSLSAWLLRRTEIPTQMLLFVSLQLGFRQKCILAFAAAIFRRNILRGVFCYGLFPPQWYLCGHFTLCVGIFPTQKPYILVVIVNPTCFVFWCRHIKFHKKVLIK